MGSPQFLARLIREQALGGGEVVDGLGDAVGANSSASQASRPGSTSVSRT